MESTIGRRIQLLREEKEMSVAKFADVAGVKPTAIYGIERGDNKPSFDVLARLSEHFADLNSNWLLKGEGRMLRALSPVEADPTPIDAVPAVLPNVRRKVSRPLMVAEPNLDHLPPEKQIDYWKQRYKKEILRQAEEFETKEHEETLQLIGNGPSFNFASADAADVYNTVDAIAFYYPAASDESLEQVRSLARFVPTPRVRPMYPKVGFQQQAV